MLTLLLPQAAWLAKWLLVVVSVVANGGAAAAAVSAYAGDSGDSSPVCGGTPCYTQGQFVSTAVALTALSSSMEGLDSYWANTANFEFCVYTGVTCRQNGVTVVASGQRLTGSLPEISDVSKPSLSMVTSLDLSNNPSVEGTVPASWVKYLRLRRLMLSGTSVSGSLPAAWSALPELQAIDLRSTGLRGTLPDTWANMTQLTTLLLNGTLVSGTIPESWGALKSLRTLGLSGTSVTGCLPKAWVCERGWTEMDVGLRAANCPTAAQQCERGGGGGSNGSRTWVIPVAVVCSVVGAVLLMLLVYCCWKCCGCGHGKAEPAAALPSVPVSSDVSAASAAPRRDVHKAAVAECKSAPPHALPPPRSATPPVQRVGPANGLVVSPTTNPLCTDAFSIAMPPLSPPPTPRRQRSFSDVSDAAVASTGFSYEGQV